MQIDFISIFPELIAHWFSQGVVGRALETDHLSFTYTSPRQFSDDRHGRIDDRPFGGGPGMVMQYEPLTRTAEHLNASGGCPPFHIFLSPQGEPFNHQMASVLAQKPRLALWCGRYEGVDQRFIDETIDAQISIGDFVISGGEIAAAIVADAVARLIPGVLGDHDSAIEDSFHQQIFDHPHYTRPKNTGNICAPEILLSGNHANIARWRLKQALGNTFLQRPDIFKQLDLNGEQITLLNEFLAENTLSGEPS